MSDLYKAQAVDVTRVVFKRIEDMERLSLRDLEEVVRLARQEDFPGDALVSFDFDTGYLTDRIVVRRPQT